MIYNEGSINEVLALSSLWAYLDVHCPTTLSHPRRDENPIASHEADVVSLCCNGVIY